MYFLFKTRPSTYAKLVPVFRLKRSLVFILLLSHRLDLCSRPIGGLPNYKNVYVHDAKLRQFCSGTWGIEFKFQLRGRWHIMWAVSYW